MNHLRHRHTPWLLLLALASWMLGVAASAIHHAEVEHAVCAEHGDLVEVDSDEPSGHEDGEEQHEHGCAFDALTVVAVASLYKPTTATTTFELGPPGPDRHRVASNPVLAFAPKTSPPTS
jgi:hypothetical protein